MTTEIAMTSQLIDKKKSTRQTWIRYLSVGVIAAGAVIPLVLQDAPFLMILASQALIAAIVAISLDLLTGNIGLLSFGHAGWFGLGAYSTGLLSQHLTAEMLIVVPMGMIIAILVAWAVGYILVRQIGKAFAILTLAFSQVLYALIFVFSHVTGGEDGLQGVPIPTVFSIQLAEPLVWYWLIYVALLASLFAAFYLRRSPLGKAWLGIRENTERAYFIGLNVARLKLISYVISAGMAAMAGGIFVLFNGATSPEILSWFESGKILMYAVLGGIGTIIGPALGAVVFTVAEHFISSYTDAWLIYFGALFIIIVIVAPGGIAGFFNSGATLRDTTPSGDKS